MSDSLADTASASRGGRGIPLSLSQQAALLPERMRRTPAVNLFVALEIVGGLDAERLDRAAGAVLARHEILRTVYPDDRRIPYQRTVDAPDSVLESVETADLDGDLRADAGHRFDLVRELPLRMRLYRLPDRDVLTLAVHPVAADDRSLELLLAELFATYGGETVPAAQQYRTFAAAQLKALAADASADPDLAYWLRQLTELPERATVAAADALAESAPSAPRSFQIPSDVLGALAAEAEPVVVAVLARALSEAGLGEEVAIGITAAGRAPGAEAALGNFANYLVLRTRPADERTPRELIADTTRLVAEARSHAGARIERLTHELRGAAAVATGAPFQALVTVRPVLSVAGRTVRELARRVARPHGVDIVVDISGEDAATVRVDFSDALAGRPEGEEFASLLQRLCANWAAAPDLSLAQQADAVAPHLFEREDPEQFGATGLGGPPRTDAERALAAAIRQILELDEDDPVGRADTFFSLGGDSIGALKLVTLLAEQGYALDVQKVFEYPAIHELAEQLSAAEPAAAQPAAPEVAPMSASGLDPAALAALGRKFADR
ncbi:condensation domain-containing protein [Nocardia sp. CDC159]|uniref:Condensation domain-containing protein n=1 Tax=Nocardia pulmonis TaxID=2951408 RepID=A0A9X2E926_9NOCA|nr:MULTISPECIES: condensation domain-containing protein [Nocardia]MCM6776029.1 condensation domain-containing protein [Nocardia pulmonis]MCM6788644.1 condensation domain-containing protein [Nocardia sp. CDC159]